MSLPDEEVLELLRARFVLAHRNIEKEGHVGLSHGYRPTQSAVGTTNGAGGRNVQFVVLAGDETVLHVLPGFWHPDDLITELQLALEVDRLHRADGMSMRRKLQMYGKLHEAHLRRHGDDLTRRGQWQHFDRSHELQRAQTEPRDTVRTLADGSLELRSIPEVLHDRMARRPFLKLEQFDLETFVDYGRPYYDNNMGHDRGRDFLAAQRSNERREREREKAAKAAQREAEKAALRERIANATRRR